MIASPAGSVTLVGVLTVRPSTAVAKGEFDTRVGIARRLAVRAAACARHSHGQSIRRFRAADREVRIALSREHGRKRKSDQLRCASSACPRSRSVCVDQQGRTGHSQLMSDSIGTWVRDVLVIPITASIGTGIYTGFLVGRIVGFTREINRARERLLTLVDRFQLMVEKDNEHLAAHPCIGILSGYFAIAPSSASTIRGGPSPHPDKHDRSKCHGPGMVAARNRNRAEFLRRRRAFCPQDEELIQTTTDHHFDRLGVLMNDAMDEFQYIKPDWNVILLGGWAGKKTDEKEQGI